MKQLITLFIFFSTFSWCGLTYAQTVSPKAQNRLEQFKAEKRAYLIKEIGLTPAEEKQFFPLYEELQSKKFQLNRKVRGEMKRIAHSTMPVSENEYAASAAAINDLPLQEALLEKEYFEKFKKILSPKKMFLYKRAEALFAKKLLKDHRPAK
ncbi:hypothetical protein [Coprobacter secundus]|uniref:Periplasmic heavy metal sensor n=1 Tax=Coprobacter secundus subsp. similis TaxID=2751153 RepID=A0A7G1HVA9_9BACT|nr:hypothetical protein [Coprobacter secundus]KHM48717.1 hypothetical protein PU94_03540 [Coprobacter secundus]BCI63480.1 hypothetical protein Cop2CBH44_18330 [Coprobacter secundus subsp. similis]CCY36342.1 putative uncharacterized protein [Tannerella sp. CAG:118]